MWLIDTSTFQLQYHNDASDLEYVILSHTWDVEEVTFQDMKEIDQARLKAGFAKIEAVCRLGRKKGITRAWVDTCCIDKSSSAELTESINSMFRWYKEASVCVTFLQDLQPGSDNNEITRCKWFTRGWTLQELIAPASLEFYDNEWGFRGTKATLAHLVLEATGVDAEALDNSEVIYNIPVGRRMSWAATRVTTRIEDVAYSLLGIFDVNMPLIYGEGDKAFLRLQETIARETDDLSLLAWSTGYEDGDRNLRGAFAKSPSEFRSSGDLLNINNPLIETPSFTVTNKGLEVHTRLHVGFEEDYLLSLHCGTEEDPDYVVHVRLVKSTRGFLRVANGLYGKVQSDMSYQTPVPILIPKHIRLKDSEQFRKHLEHSFCFRIEDSPPIETQIFPQCPQHLWDEARQRYLSGGYKSFTCFVKLSSSFAPNRYSNYVALCGLVLMETDSTDGAGGSVATKNSQVEPWAMLLNRQTDWKSLFKMMDDAKDDPFALNNIGHDVRSRVLKAEPSKRPSTSRIFQENKSTSDSRSLLPSEHQEFVIAAQISIETKMTSGFPEHTVVIKVQPHTITSSKAK